MAVKFKRKKWNTLYNSAAAMILICFIFFLLMNFFYHDAENKAYNSLRAEATYIKKIYQSELRQTGEILLIWQILPQHFMPTEERMT